MKSNVLRINGERSTVLLSTINVMFLANDANDHDIAYSRIAGGWMLENRERGHIRTLPNLVAALSELERVSGNRASQFTIVDNPYHGD